LIGFGGHDLKILFRMASASLENLPLAGDDAASPSKFRMLNCSFFQQARFIEWVHLFGNIAHKVMHQTWG